MVLVFIVLPLSIRGIVWMVTHEPAPRPVTKRDVERTKEHKLNLYAIVAVGDATYVVESIYLLGRERVYELTPIPDQAEQKLKITPGITPHEIWRDMTIVPHGDPMWQSTLQWILRIQKGKQLPRDEPGGVFNYLQSSFRPVTS